MFAIWIQANIATGHQAWDKRNEGPDLGKVEGDKRKDAQGGHDDSYGGSVMAGSLSQNSRQEAPLCHAQKLEGVRAHFCLELANLTDCSRGHNPPRQPIASHLHIKKLETLMEYYCKS